MFDAVFTLFHVSQQAKVAVSASVKAYMPWCARLKQMVVASYKGF